MDFDSIKRIHGEHWRVGYGSASVEEMEQMRAAIAHHRPRSFVEIGTASGLSSGLLAHCLEANGGERLVTLDYDNTFFGDPTKENGFLIPLIYPSDGKVKVDRRVFNTALDLPAKGETFEMAFIDANHQHPWTLLDTLCLYAVMTGPKLVFQHDLRLFRKQPLARGVGPKVLFDQFPESHRKRFDVNEGNLFTVSLDLDQQAMEDIAADAFSIPWTLTKKLTDETVEAFRVVLRDHFSAELLALFDERSARFNVPTGKLYKVAAAN